MGPSRHSFLSRFGPTSESEVFGGVDVDHTVTRLLNPEFVRADLHVILELQQTSSWNAEEMHVPGFVVYENVSGLTTLIVSDRLCNAQRTWRSEERCAAVLFEFT